MVMVFTPAFDIILWKAQSMLKFMQIIEDLMFVNFKSFCPGALQSLQSTNKSKSTLS